MFTESVLCDDAVYDCWLTTTSAYTDDKICTGIHAHPSGFPGEIPAGRYRNQHATVSLYEQMLWILSNFGNPSRKSWWVSDCAQPFASQTRADLGRICIC